MVENLALWDQLQAVESTTEQIASNHISWVDLTKQSLVMEVVSMEIKSCMANTVHAKECDTTNQAKNLDVYSL